MENVADGADEIGERKFDALPHRVQEALGELAGAAREALLALSVGVGLGVLTELMAEEVEDVVGPKAATMSIVRSPTTCSPLLAYPVGRAHALARSQASVCSRRRQREEAALIASQVRGGYIRGGAASHDGPACAAFPTYPALA